MKKFSKRIATMGAAVMMAVSMMSMSVSASAQSFGLHYTYSAGSNNVLSQSFGNTSSSPFTANTTNHLYIWTDTRNHTFTAVKTTTWGAVYSGGKWNNVARAYNYTKEKSYGDGSFYNITTSSKIKVTVTMDYGSLKSASAYGTTNAY